MYFQVCSNSAYSQHSGERYRTNGPLVFVFVRIVVLELIPFFDVFRLPIVNLWNLVNKYMIFGLQIVSKV